VTHVKLPISAQVIGECELNDEAGTPFSKHTVY